MRTLNPTLALASLVGFLTAASCTLITDVDRTKIPTDAGTQAEGGSGGTGGSTGGTSATGGTSGDAGAGATGGSKGGSSGTGGTAGTGAVGGSSGSGGAPAEVCKPASGKITVMPLTYLADGDTLTLSDGMNKKVVFEFDLASGPPGVASGHTKVAFDGTEDNFGLASIISDAINAQDSAGKLGITATLPASSVLGSAGASGASGATNGGASNGGAANGGVTNGGEGGTTSPPPTGSAVIDLVNDLSGPLGNVKITDTIGNPNLTTSGMSGGDAVACSSASSCKSGSACASEDCSDENLCVQ